MQGRVDTSFQTVQRDLFASGLVARVGVNAFAVWLAIKSHADYNTGEAWPGMRRLALLTGLSLPTVLKSVHALVDARLLRVARVAKGKSKRGNTYVARERMDVRLGERVLCTIILDYVPSTMRQRLNEVQAALSSGRPAPAVFSECEILPGDGFVWDAGSATLRGVIPASDFPVSGDLSHDQLKAPLVQKVLAMRREHGRLKGAG